MSPPVETSNPHDKVYRECTRRFDNLDSGQKQIMKLLRGDGPDPGLVGDTRSHSEKIAELREVVFGIEPGTGLRHTVDQLCLNGQSRKSAEKERRTLLYGVVGPLATAAIIALAAWLLSLYRWGSPVAPRDQTAQPAAAEATDDTHTRPAR
jgi:hypothetical protein